MRAAKPADVHEFHSRVRSRRDARLPGAPTHPRRRWGVVLAHGAGGALAETLGETVVGAEEGETRHGARDERPRVAEKRDEEADDQDAEVVGAVVVHVALEAGGELALGLWWGELGEELRQGPGAHVPVHLAERVRELAGGDIRPVHRVASGCPATSRRLESRRSGRRAGLRARVATSATRRSVERVERETPRHRGETRARECARDRATPRTTSDVVAKSQRLHFLGTTARAAMRDVSNFVRFFLWRRFFHPACPSLRTSTVSSSPAAAITIRTLFPAAFAPIASR